MLILNVVGSVWERIKATLKRFLEIHVSVIFWFSETVLILLRKKEKLISIPSQCENK